MRKITKSKDVDLIDYSNEYSDLVSFKSNLYHPKHRWYPFVEGFSTEFVRRILGEQNYIPENCLEPFGGIGTTALTCQDLGVKCTSVESNPFFYKTARAKLLDYSSLEFEKLLIEFETYLTSCTSAVVLPELESKTFFESKEKNKWIFHKEVSNGIGDILGKIEAIKVTHSDYAVLFEIALANILLPVSNVFRNGKCLSYRRGWEERKFDRKEVHTRFIDVSKLILIDIRSKERQIKVVENHSTYYNADSRNKLMDLDDESFDLIITSPPYLNSRDYTDVYRLELWILGYIDKFEKEKTLRKSAITSHVQIKLPETKYPDVDEINQFLEHLNGLNGRLWNNNIPRMISGYFNDMEGILSNLHNKLKSGGRAYINVSNSAYGGKVLNVDLILSEIAQSLGFNTDEIRIARLLKSSSQQKITGPIRESVIILSKG
ncbi:hypothetical protein [Altibacter sp. HG106]|uniref:hypothetical protein n=1 Tax=Altibacter sp. HG106 TaxID=3023937 RepID=UPI00234FB6E2|nr:hypothetical protein [Altibacter sp. HG106]MDC7994044.1 hypothetical protein [Altibacter sp. HG106]